MAAVDGVAVVWFPVADIERAVGFYRDTLGMTLKQQEDEWAELEANGLRIGLNSAESAGGDGGGVLAFQPDGGIESAVDELKEQGVSFDGDIAEFEWGRIAAFRDPDGNALQFYEPPQK